MIPTVARTWRGTTRSADAEAYLAYLHRTGLAEYRRTPGNRGVLALRRTVGGETEWLLVTLWDSIDAVRRFVVDPDDPTRAVFYPDDECFLTGRDERATHFEVVHLEPPAAAGSAAAVPDPASDRSGR